MRRYLLDSNALNQLIRRFHAVDMRAEAARQAGAVIGTATPIVAEFLGGIENSDSRETNLPKALRRLNRLRLWPFDVAAAKEYGRLYAALRRKGDAVQAIDLMAAAVSLVLGDCVVVSSDKDFLRIPGIRVEDWTQSKPSESP